MYPSPEGMVRADEINHRGQNNIQVDKNINWDRVAYLRKGNSKDHEK
jgi:hypothetical protein